MSNAQDKRASEPHEDQPTKKRGRPSNEERNLKAPENSMSRVRVREMLLRHPRVRYSSQEECSFYDGLIPWPERYEWSAEDADGVQEAWKNSAIKEASRKLDTPQYNSLFLLFKISLRLYRTTPIVLFSPVCAMRYQPMSTNPKASKWIMSEKFCDTLSSIMVHPCWKADIDSLALALRWTVICRRDSRCRWTKGIKASCPVVQRTIGKVEAYGSRCLDTSYHDMHKAERERASERGERLSSLSNILYQLGEAVLEDSTKRPEVVPEYDQIFGWGVLPVTRWDLNVLAKVVDSMKFGSPWNYSVKDALNAWKAENKCVEVPSRERLSFVYECSHKSIFKYLRLFDRQQTTVPRTEEADDIGSSGSFSDDDGPQQTTPSPPHQAPRRTVVDSFSDAKSESGSENTGPPQLCYQRDDEEEDSTAMRPVDSGDFHPQATNESDRLRPHGTTLTGSPIAQSYASPVYASTQERRLLSELSEIRNENKELRDGQERLQALFAESLKGQKEQKELILSIKKQLDGVQTELSQLHQAKEAPIEDFNVQRHPEMPTLPGAADTGSGEHHQSPELGTSPSSTSQLSDFDVPAVWRTAHD